MDERSDELLLRDYADNGNEVAFREVVIRHTDAIYSAALRQVRSSDLAADVAQSVFTDLARKAPALTRSGLANISILGWLYRGTRYAALNQLRDDRRRQTRERLAMEDFNPTGDNATDWARVQLLLDEAMADLNDDDREALLLRFFKNQNFRNVGEALGVSDDAAQKRVNRALEKLRAEFARRGVTTTAAALATGLAGNAVLAAPAGMALTFSTTALAGALALTTTSAIQTIAMTTLQKTIVAAALAVAIGAGIYEAVQATRLREQLQASEQQQAALSEQMQQLQQQRDEATNRLALLADQTARAKKAPNEVLKLRSEVGQLRNENVKLNSTSALNKITADPESKKMMREQQKMAMTIVYKDLAKKLNLSEEQTAKFNDLLADNVMENIDRITESLHDKLPADQLNQKFDQQDVAFTEKLSALIGPDGVTQYEDYSKNLLGSLTAQQFEDSLTGDDAAKKDKSKQLEQLIGSQTQTAIANGNLPADYQAIPILNLRNIASEDMGNQSVQMLSNIYAGAMAQSSAFLTPGEQAKFQKFTAKALNNNAGALKMNRTLMEPIGQ